MKIAAQLRHCQSTACEMTKNNTATDQIFYYCSTNTLPYQCRYQADIHTDTHTDSFTCLVIHTNTDAAQTSIRTVTDTRYLHTYYTWYWYKCHTDTILDFNSYRYPTDDHTGTGH